MDNLKNTFFEIFKKVKREEFRIGQILLPVFVYTWLGAVLAYSFIHPQVLIIFIILPIIILIYIPYNRYKTIPKTGGALDKKYYKTVKFIINVLTFFSSVALSIVFTIILLSISITIDIGQILDLFTVITVIAFLIIDSIKVAPYIIRKVIKLNKYYTFLSIEEINKRVGRLSFLLLCDLGFGFFALLIIIVSPFASDEVLAKYPASKTVIILLTLTFLVLLYMYEDMLKESLI
jgi:hypothetical protein